MHDKDHCATENPPLTPVFSFSQLLLDRNVPQMKPDVLQLLFYSSHEA